MCAGAGGREVGTKSERDREREGARALDTKELNSNLTRESWRATFDNTVSLSESRELGNHFTLWLVFPQVFVSRLNKKFLEDIRNTTIGGISKINARTPMDPRPILTRTR